MKRYFGLNNREENLLVYGNLVNSVLNSSLIAPLVYFGYCVIKSEGLLTFVNNYKANVKAWNYGILVFGSLKVLFWIFETYCFGKATWNLSRTEKFENVK